MNAPQIIWIVLITISLTYDLIKHGERKEGRHDFVASVIGAAATFLLLWWGGFFGGAR